MYRVTAKRQIGHAVVAQPPEGLPQVWERARHVQGPVWLASGEWA
ncbi:hypothetical protein LAUMK35_04384 [Mycobacterium pseudokansasii]|uniref:Uncharacterized protein n=1 Tax=Mycobacterium pseudokansasii TaxID=2341080 RepID=A0A498QZD9_9MYCO|nr:hypothetical protein LAUMK35_04384 [Mycobacterium pseudokansasii]VBA30822.1 hypothetical protein LAUMK21_04377 [Mycobacterium pseudokansasii]VBA53759.1 hypothetical protein LAUMK142_04277 [Mycobacterium pseudokansasii]